MIEAEQELLANRTPQPSSEEPTSAPTQVPTATPPANK